MKKTFETIVFFGSGPVAAQSLQLLAEHFEIEAVITKPRPPHHRGDVPVLDAAADLKLPVLTVQNRRELDELIKQHRFTSNLGVLIDFGIIVSQAVIDAFAKGIVNSHFSILPEWRGADPITFSILSGQKQTGVSLMLLTAGMDEGPLLAYGEYTLPSDITTPTLTNDLINLSDALLQEELPRYISGDAVLVTQDITGRAVSYSRKLTKEDGTIDWHKPAEQIEREIRAFIGWPRSYTVMSDLSVVITKVHIISHTGAPGTFAVIDKKLVAFCGQQALAIDEIQPAGKRPMSGKAFLAGYRKYIAI